jgi:hypothetical protein
MGCIDILDAASCFPLSRNFISLKVTCDSGRSTPPHGMATTSGRRAGGRPRERPVLRGGVSVAINTQALRVQEPSMARDHARVDVGLMVVRLSVTMGHIRSWFVSVYLSYGCTVCLTAENGGLRAGRQ